MQRLIAGAAVALSMSALAHAQKAEGPIDAALTACLNTHDGETTAGQLDCVDRARDAWDKRLNAAYAKLMRTLDPTSKALLQDAQRSWLTYFEKDSAFGAGPWRQTTGTLEMVILANLRLSALRQRTEMLENYAEPD